MFRSLGKVIRRRPGTAALVLALLVLAGTVCGLYGYAFHQWRRAQAAVKEGRPGEARSRLGFCLVVWPRSVRTHLLAARAARLSGDFEQAEAHLNRCLRLQSEGNPDIELEFLLMRVQMGEVDEVAPVLLKYVENNHPEAPLILETLSRAYMHNLRYGPALICLNRWAQEAPESAQPLHWRGWVLERLNDSAGAMRDYKRALELSPDLVAVRLRLAELFLEKSNPPAALEHLEHLRGQFPDRPDIQARMGQCRLLQGKRKEARPLLEAAVEHLPNDAPLLISLAKLELDEERPAKAEQYLRRLLKVDPTDTEAQYVLVTSLRLQGRRKEAEAALEQYEKDKALVKRANRLLQEEAERPTRHAGPLTEIGTLFLRAGQERLGLYWLERALQRDRGHRPTHKALAEHYEKKGERDKAATHRRWLAKKEGGENRKRGDQ
jgi:tetratricopeptide (TPR) repeat protein